MTDTAVLALAANRGDNPGMVTRSNPVPVAQRTLALLSPGMPTFYAQSQAYASYATPTDLCALRNPLGSGKIVIPRIMGLSIGSTTAALMKFFWYRRASLNTGGTPTDIVPVQYDSAGAAAVAVPRVYGAAPTIVDAAAIINQLQLSTAVLTAAPANANSSGASSGWAFGTSDLPSPLILRPGEELAMNLAGAAIPSGFTSIFQVTWMEVATPS